MRSHGDEEESGSVDEGVDEWGRLPHLIGARQPLTPCLAKHSITWARFTDLAIGTSEFGPRAPS